MSWYGTHAIRTKEEVKSMLPAAACKHCIYWFQVAIGSSSETWYHRYETCPRCGIRQWDLLDQFTAEANSRLTTGCS
ncbi:hypothetical protein Pr1d_34360 [Bythopirellula goksoeyrii]|uniref:Uncharacterized protein n=1 Tax=Bythopirellula goksoeyrii TaxID=1400387 RepID=A0A5B9QAT6_9BACT|nr:hypothetical protein Pr1d_17020 [Bythopirellula goksoeyrii]QEG36127.1 hypothetical protein Pr1d_34360 [Bythopirellula goksoeyrii]